MTTPVDGGLAVAVQIYSYHPDEVTGATLNGGETGGTWTKAGEVLGIRRSRRADWPPNCRRRHDPRAAA